MATSGALNVLLIPAICLFIFGEVTNVIDARPYLALFGFTLLIGKTITLEEVINESKLNLVDISVLLVTISELINYFTSTYQANSFHSLFDTLLLVTFYWLVRAYLRHDSQVIVVIAFVAALAFYVQVTALFSFASQYNHVASLGFTRINDLRSFFHFLRPPGSPVAEWITVFLMFLPFPILLLIQFKENYFLTKILLLPILVGLITIVLTFSRGLYIATVTFVVSASALCYFKKIYALRPLAYFNVSMAMLVLIFLVVTPFWQPVRQTASLFGTSSQIRSFDARFAVWKTGKEIFWRHPVTGIGTHNFALYYASAKEKAAPYAGRTLNWVLQILVEKGILGLIAYMFLFAAFFVACFKTIKSRGDNSFYLASVIVFMSVCAAALVRDLSYSSIFSNRAASVLLWFMFASTSRQLSFLDQSCRNETL